MTTIPLKKFIPAILWFLLVMVLICLPGQEFPEMDGWSAWLKKLYFDKMVHAGMFGVMMILFSWPFKTTPYELDKKLSTYWLIAILTCIWGLVTECIQLYVPFRSFDWIDWLADSAGAFAGLYYMRLFPTK